jgi:DNA-binding transcriptional ArsR family regulator
MTTAQLQTDEDRLWRICKALGNPVRLQIVRYVLQRPGCIGNEILLNLPDDAPHAQSTLSQHLRVLRDAGVLEAQDDGPAVCYHVCRATLAWLRDQMADIG